MRMASSFHSKACREGRLSSRYGFEKGGWCLVIGYRINACKLHRTALITVPAGGQKNGGQKNKRRHFSVALHLTVVIGATSNLGFGSLPWTPSWLLWLPPWMP